MDSLAYSMLKQKLMSSKADSFQLAIDTIYGIVHETSFVPVKQKRDKGSDGFLFGTTSLAVYAPEKYLLSDFKKKTKDDFLKYQQNWKNSFPVWNVLTNLENTGEMLTHVNGLYSAANLVSVTSTCDLVRAQSWSKIARIFKALGLPESYLSYDIFTMIVDDVSAFGQGTMHYDNPIYVTEKIQLNVEDEESRESFLEEYESYLVDFGSIQKVLSSFPKEKVAVLRGKVLSTYQSLGGQFLERLSATAMILSGTRSADDYYCLHIRKILFYLFEQCLVGRKTTLENNHASPGN